MCFLVFSFFNKVYAWQNQFLVYLFKNILRIWHLLDIVYNRRSGIIIRTNFCFSTFNAGEIGVPEIA